MPVKCCWCREWFLDPLKGTLEDPGWLAFGRPSERVLCDVCCAKWKVSIDPYALLARMYPQRGA